MIKTSVLTVRALPPSNALGHLLFPLAKVILINGENGVDPALALNVDAIKKKEKKTEEKKKTQKGGEKLL